jgi:hypothetical protein
MGGDSVFSYAATNVSIGDRKLHGEICTYLHEVMTHKTAI